MKQKMLIGTKTAVFAYIGENSTTYVGSCPSVIAKAIANALNLPIEYGTVDFQLLSKVTHWIINTTGVNFAQQEDIIRKFKTTFIEGKAWYSDSDDLINGAHSEDEWYCNIYYTVCIDGIEYIFNTEEKLNATDPMTYDEDTNPDELDTLDEKYSSWVNRLDLNKALHY